MNIEECVEMMEKLRQTYSSFAMRESVKENNFNKLKNVLVQIEMNVVSMRKSIVEAEKKKTTSQKASKK
jgi:hypothetical protein